MTTEPAETPEVEGWRPEPGDQVEGTLVDVSEATSTQRNAQGEYPTYPLLKIRKADGSGEVFVHAFHGTLQRELLERRPQVGHRIRVKFLGKKQLKSDANRSVALYTLETPDTPKNINSVYDRVDRARQQRGRTQTAPVVPAPEIPIDDDFDF